MANITYATLGVLTILLNFNIQVLWIKSSYFCG